eukprot:1367774-Amorphochlora_amoeboformis.AAC.2
MILARRLYPSAMGCCNAKKGRSDAVADPPGIEGRGGWGDDEDQGKCEGADMAENTPKFGLK